MVIAKQVKKTVYEQKSDFPFNTVTVLFTLLDGAIYRNDNVSEQSHRHILVIRLIVNAGGSPSLTWKRQHVRRTIYIAISTI